MLSYSCESLNFNRKQLSQLNVRWNNIYRKIVNMNLWESVKELMCFCERVDSVHLHAERKLLFVQKLFQAASNALCILCLHVYNVM